MAGIENVADHLKDNPRRVEIEEALRMTIGDSEDEFGLAVENDDLNDNLNDDGYPMTEPVHHQVLLSDFVNHDMEQDELQELLG